MVAGKEYTYLLNFSMWEMGKEFWPDKNEAGDGSLEPEWNDNALTKEGLLSEKSSWLCLIQQILCPSFI